MQLRGPDVSIACKMATRAGAGTSGSPRPKKQNHANIPCPIENCARFTYGKLPDHLTKRHGLVGAERDAVNEQQRKRFFNGELCQVRFLKEVAIRELWGADYDDPRIRAKIHDGYAMVKIRIIPLAATAHARPLTEQDANVLTNYNARTEPRAARPQARRRRPACPPTPEHQSSSSTKRRKSCESSEGDENNSGRASDLASLASSPPSSPPSPTRPILPPTPPPSEASPRPLQPSTPPSAEERLHDILDSNIDDGYKFVINDMKKSMTVGRALGPRKRKMHRTYRRYAKRLISYLHRQHSPLAYDVDLLLCSEPHVRAFLERVRAHFKPKTVRNYIVAAIKLLDSRLFALETDPGCKEKVLSMTQLYDALHRHLKECESQLADKPTAPTMLTNTQRHAHAHPLAESTQLAQGQPHTLVSSSYLPVYGLSNFN